MKRHATVIAAGFVLISLVPFAHAGMPGSKSGGSAYSGNAVGPRGIGSSVDDATLKKAAHAFTKVRNINAEISQTMRRTTGRQDKQKILANARVRELKALRREGLSPEQYNAVLRKVESDPALNAKFASYVKAQGRSGM